MCVYVRVCVGMLLSSLLTRTIYFCMLELCSSIRLGSKNGNIHTHTHAHTRASIKNRLGKTVSVHAHKQAHTCTHRHTHTRHGRHDRTRHDTTRHDTTHTHTRIGHACTHWVACTDTQAHTGTHPQHQHLYPHAHSHANADTHTYAHTPLGLGGADGLRLRLYGSARPQHIWQMTAFSSCTAHRPMKYGPRKSTRQMCSVTPH